MANLLDRTGRGGETEPLILSGYEGMKTREASIPLQHKPRLTQAAGRVVKLYEACGMPDKVAKWRKEVEKMPVKP